MQLRDHSVWQSQHHWKPHWDRLQIMCMQPPSLSVGVRHMGQGLVVERTVSRLASSHRLSLACASSTGYADTLPNAADASSCSSRMHGPKW